LGSAREAEKCILLSNFAFYFNLHRYTQAADAGKPISWQDGNNQAGGLEREYHLVFNVSFSRLVPDHLEDAGG